MYENLEEEAFKLSNEFRRITPFLVIRRFKLNSEMAMKLCRKVWLRQHNEARKLAKEIEFI